MGVMKYSKRPNRDSGVWDTFKSLLTGNCSLCGSLSDIKFDNLFKRYELPCRFFETSYGSRADVEQPAVKPQISLPEARRHAGVRPEVLNLTGNVFSDQCVHKIVVPQKAVVFPGNGDGSTRVLQPRFDSLQGP